MELLLGLMVAGTKENLKKIILKDLAIIHGLMVGNTKDHGKTTKCMAEVYFYGQMDVNMKENI